MMPIMYLVFLLIPLCFASPSKASRNLQYQQHQKTIEEVFGKPSTYHQAVQASIEDPTATLVDPDYWDSYDDFMPSSLKYDDFDWALTKRVTSLSPENVLLSPLGLKLALAILKEAATGATAAELESVLGFDPNRQTVRRKFDTILDSLQTKSSQYILNLGSRIYVDNEPRQMFAAIAEEFYRTEVKKINFDQPAHAVKEINFWVANITDGRIPDLVQEEDVVGTVIMVLNTIYFKGSWRHQFRPNETKAGTFYVDPKTPVQVPFMNIKDKFFFIESAKLDAKILRMPYLGKKFSMYIVVPNSHTGLPRVMDGLNFLRSELMYMQEYTVDVSIPKFNFEFTSQLDGVLKDMGIRQAFEDTASFPGIARGQLLSQRLKISKVLQRSGIDVNELGSIAYSATEIALVNKFGEDSDSRQEVIANKPFLFYIEDEATRQLLFTGRVNNPAQPEGKFKSA